MKELQSLGLDVKIMDEHDNEIDMQDNEEEDVVERKVDLPTKKCSTITKRSYRLIAFKFINEYAVKSCVLC